MEKDKYSNQGGAVRKRQQISSSNKQMFIWVAAMSAVVGASLVVCWFVWQQVAAKNEVINAKNETSKTLELNNQAVVELRENIAVLDTNTSLMDSRARDEDRALQAILDALPAVHNPLALGASVENNLTVGINGLTLTNLAPADAYSDYGDIAVDESSQPISGSGMAEGVQQVAFTMTVEASNAGALREMLSRFERSIRVINIDNIKLDRSSTGYVVSISAHGFYQQGKIIEMTERKL